MIGDAAIDRSALGRLRLALLSDVRAQDRIGAMTRQDALRAIADFAATLSIPLGERELQQGLVVDMLGLERFAAQAANASHPPSARWLPTGIGSDGSQYIVEWAHFGSKPLVDPFFESSLRWARNHPLSQAAACRTPLVNLLEDAALADQPPPDGLVFHMSRCGSTLLAQVLAAIPGSVVLSEPAPFDQAIHIAQSQQDIEPELRVRLVRSMAAALLSDRLGDTRKRFIKLDCWHALAMPLLRAAFPNTPWIFMFRDPLAVMLSHQSMPGSQTVPGMIGVDFGIADPFSLSRSAFTARALAAVCHHGAEAAHNGGGLYLDYAELPGAILTRALPHFGISADDLPASSLEEVLARDSKAPYMPWDPARLPGPSTADGELVAACMQHLAPAVAKLAALAERERTA
jgi:hypothetical protein